MAQETAIAYGIEFYVGRRSRDRAISDVRAAGELVNQQALMSYKKGSKERQTEHDKAVGKLRERSEQAMTALGNARKRAATDAAKSFSAMVPSKEQYAKDIGVDKLDDSQLKEYTATFGREIRGMDSAMTDFVSRSADMGMNLGKAADTQGVMQKFAESDVQDRTRAITDLETQKNLNKEILKDRKAQSVIVAKEEKKARDKHKLTKKELANARRARTMAKKKGEDLREHDNIIKKLVKREDTHNNTLKKQIKLREDIIREMEELEDLTEGQRKILIVLQDEHKKLTAEERKYGKIQGDIKREEIRLGRTLTEQDKKELMNLKEKNRMLQEYTRHIDEAAEKVGSTLKTAFVVGTAAIAALNYKLMAVAQSFMEFEKQLVNANSIWQESNDTLFEISDSVVEFGTKFGVEMQNATSGLYQYASAGVEAAQAMEMLQHTLKLSMAVQGDHNTLSKLTTQTIMGFSMEFSQAEEVTDKFAHAINKSLIEWDDLASSIKFALPFFISTGQSIDQLLGGLQVLTNRALEAGIAGRGLRQALAEFTQHADDNSAAFRKLGIEIMTVEGNMKPLNVIAQEFANVMGEGVTDMEVMIALMEDLNVRGATAFVHLVQNADEFTAAVNDLANSGGSAHEMAMIQQTSLANQIQVVKNAMMAPFLLSDKIGAEAGYLNMFAMELHGIVDVVENLFIKTLSDGSIELTKMSEIIRDFVIGALRQAKDVLVIVVDVIGEFADKGHAMTGMMKAAAAPLRVVATLLGVFGPGLIEAVVAYKILNGLIPLNSMVLASNINVMMSSLKVKGTSVQMQKAEVMWGNKMVKIHMVDNQWRYVGRNVRVSENKLKESSIVLDNQEVSSKQRLNGAVKGLIASQIMSKMVMMGAMLITQKYAKSSMGLAAVIGAVAGAYMGYAIALNQVASAKAEVAAGGWLLGSRFTEAAIMGAAVGGAFNVMLQQMMKPPDMSEYEQYDIYDTGGRFMNRKRYDMGGRYTQDHGLAMLQKGETVISKTQNMLGGATGGITLNIHGDVYDSDNFAQKISEVLPMAIRKTNDIGGI